MAIDVVDLQSFYAQPVGAMTRRILTDAVRALWPRSTGLVVAGFGFATPYLVQARSEAERTLAFMPARQGVVNWPAPGLSASALVDPSLLPIRDGTIDRALIVHGLETTSDPRAFLDEVWRALSPGGRIIVIAPNRSGLWARMDATPFGHGQPFSRGQLKQLLRDSLFSPEHWSEALYAPPIRRRYLMGSAAAWEKVGARLSLPFAGVHLIEATKQLYRPALVRKVRYAEQGLTPVLAPASGTAGRCETEPPISGR